MPMTNFSTNLQQSMTWFRKHHPQMDLNFHNHQNDTVSEELDDHHNYYHTNDPMATNSQHYFYSNQPTATATATSTACQINNNEPMFEKPLTPSDVGKLNRLVIPKQHAEKYFPLNRTNFINNDDSSSPPSSGTLLTFEDELGKSWKFRYSYWNSSQSYVLTKGWSRYVKEKRLDAGDVVFFQRDMGSLDRLFIGWRRRTGDGCRTAVQDSKSSYGSGHVIRGGGYGGQDSLYSGCSVGQLHGLEFGIAPPPPPYRPDHCFHAGTAMQLSQTPGDGSNSNSISNTNPRRLIRLFGVNFECQEDDSQTTSLESTSSLSSQHHSVPSSSSVYGGNYFDYDGTNNVYHRSHFHHQMGV